MSCTYSCTVWHFCFSPPQPSKKLGMPCRSSSGYWRRHFQQLAWLPLFLMIGRMESDYAAWLLESFGRDQTSQYMKVIHVLVGPTFQNGTVIHVCFYAWMILEDCFVAFLCWLSLLFGADCLDVKESSRLWSRKKKHMILNWQKYTGSLNIQQPYFCSGQTTNMTWNAVRSPWRISRKRFQEGSTSLTVTTNRRNVEFDLEQRFVSRCSKQFLGLLSLIGLYLHHRLHHGTDRVWCICGAILNWSSQTRHTTLWEKWVLFAGVSLDGER